MGERMTQHEFDEQRAALVRSAERWRYAGRIVTEADRARASEHEKTLENARLMNEREEMERTIKALADAAPDIIASLESTRWSSGCWCSGKDKRGHSATCAGRQASINQMETALRLAGRL